MVRRGSGVRFPSPAPPKPQNEALFADAERQLRQVQLVAAFAEGVGEDAIEWRNGRIRVDGEGQLSDAQTEELLDALKVAASHALKRRYRKVALELLEYLVAKYDPD